MRKVLEVLLENKLYVNLRRCILSVVSYVLGFIVSENDIQVEFTYISIKHGTIGKTLIRIQKDISYRIIAKKMVVMSKLSMFK